MNIANGVLEERYRNQFSVIYADILEVKEMTSKGSAKEEAE
jgi:hypothetical protein